MGSVNLADIDSVELEQQPGQVFFNAADIRMKGANGETLFRLSGVKDAGAFKSTIERTAEARRMVKDSMQRIEARG